MWSSSESSKSVQAAQITDGTVRVAVGIEGRQDLERDFLQALKSLAL